MPTSIYQFHSQELNKIPKGLEDGKLCYDQFPLSFGQSRFVFTHLKGIDLQRSPVIGRCRVRQGPFQVMVSANGQQKLTRGCLECHRNLCDPYGKNDQFITSALNPVKMLLISRQMRLIQSRCDELTDTCYHSFVFLYCGASMHHCLTFSKAISSQAAFKRITDFL